MKETSNTMSQQEAKELLSKYENTLNEMQKIIEQKATEQQNKTLINDIKDALKAVANNRKPSEAGENILNKGIAKEDFMTIITHGIDYSLLRSFRELTGIINAKTYQNAKTYKKRLSPSDKVRGELFVEKMSLPTWQGEFLEDIQHINNNVTSEKEGASVITGTLKAAFREEGSQVNEAEINKVRKEATKTFKSMGTNNEKSFYDSFKKLLQLIESFGKTILDSFITKIHQYVVDSQREQQHEEPNKHRDKLKNQQSQLNKTGKGKDGR